MEKISGYPMRVTFESYKSCGETCVNINAVIYKREKHADIVLGEVCAPYRPKSVASYISAWDYVYGVYSDAVEQDLAEHKKKFSGDAILAVAWIITLILLIIFSEF